MTAPGHGVTWAHQFPTQPPAHPGGWAAPLPPRLPLALVLRLVAAGLAALAGVLVAGGSFPPLLRVGIFDAEYTLAGWSEDTPGQLARDALLFGVPLTVAAAALLTAAGLLIGAVRRARLGYTATAALVGGTALLVAEFWTIGSYVSDFIDLVNSGIEASVDASRGAGYWLLLTAVLVACAGLVCAVVAEIAARRPRPSTAASPGPSDQSWRGPHPGVPAAGSGSTGWLSPDSAWGGSR